MPRRPRHEIPGGFYHVTQRGNGGSSIFDDDDDRAFFLAMLTRVVVREHWSCFVYCLMTNHYHLVIQIHEASLSRGMRWLNGLYAQYFNQRHARCGHLFGGRYRTAIIETEQHLTKACVYVELNPVRAGLCADEAGWVWSSYRARNGLGAAPPFLAPHPN